MTTPPAPRGHSPDVSGADHRGTERLAPSAALKANLIDDIGTSQAARVVNLSKGGICLAVGPGVDVELGSLFTVELLNGSNSFQVGRQIRVVYVIDQSPAERLVGCACSQELADAEVQSLL